MDLLLLKLSIDCNPQLLKGESVTSVIMQSGSHTVCSKNAQCRACRCSRAPTQRFGFEQHKRKDRIF